MARMPVEQGKIREYALATANGRPEYLDDPRAPIPPTFLSTVVFWDDPAQALRAPEAAAALAALGIEPDVRRLLSAEQEYVFHGPLPRAGDTLETSVRFDRAVRKEGRRGPLLFIHFTIEFRDQAGALVAECHYTSAYVAEPGATA
ncbi:FAS1-like dehydratase domain-containing protein [Amycolatopsis sp.]|uniref:FAS1-like dehydratase domain-containing protein n=1 Tax=Amycolatopsis sp. TaxID=37632 RepID=UPI002C0588FB|nr:MaoC family dehydratase N-terminal domain-containing protein [Amycolatopsis sp.]HVV12652.1 MaoC family dehydratase N-terminal domain-containing protein [Amycolatopsis sp.]